MIVGELVLIIFVIASFVIFAVSTWQLYEIFHSKMFEVSDLMGVIIIVLFCTSMAIVMIVIGISIAVLLESIDWTPITNWWNTAI